MRCVHHTKHSTLCQLQSYHSRIVHQRNVFNFAVDIRRYAGMWLQPIYLISTF